MELLEGGDLLQNIMKGLLVWEGLSKSGSFFKSYLFIPEFLLHDCMSTVCSGMLCLTA